MWNQSKCNRNSTRDKISRGVIMGFIVASFLLYTAYRCGLFAFEKEVYIDGQRCVVVDYSLAGNPIYRCELP